MLQHGHVMVQICRLCCTKLYVRSTVVLTPVSDTVMLSARFEVKHVSGMGGRSPPRGGAAVSAPNQQFLADSDQEAADDRQADANTGTDNSQRASKRRKVQVNLSLGILLYQLTCLRCSAIVKCRIRVLACAPGISKFTKEIGSQHVYTPCFEHGSVPIAE